MKPKFSWEPLDGGSLLLRVTDGDKTTTWTLKPRQQNNTISSVLQEVASALADTDTYYTPQPVTPQRWSGVPMVESAETIDDVELAIRQEKKQLTEEDSRRALAAKAASVLANANWFDREDDSYENLEIKTLGTGTSSGW